MNKPDVKKLILLNLPYVFAFYFADKIAAVFRLAPGTEFIDKLTNGFAVFGTAFANPLPSFHPVDLLIGVIAGALLKLAVYVKGKNRKKFRQGEEYGSARWGKPEDIKPYTDPEFSNNVILTQTEFLTMNSRPKQPKYARNKNILVIGGSGSGKTRFFVKPNLMQMHSSYVVTDPKGTVLIGKCTYREFTTGFFFGKPDSDTQIYDSNTYVKNYIYIGTVNEVDEKGRAIFNQKNRFFVGDNMEIMKKNGENISLCVESIEDEKDDKLESAPHPLQLLKVTFDKQVAEEGDILRIYNPERQ